MACDPGANAFIEKYFADCVYNLRDYIGFCLGITAILFWLVAQVPQYVRNYKTKSADALSPWFLASWLLGDTTNLLGCLLQGQQLPTTTYTAMYFVMADVFMMMQYIYYGALNRRREKLLQLQARRRHHHRRHQHHSSSSSSHTPSGSQQRHAAGSSSSPSRRQPQQDEGRQQQQQQGQRHVTYSIDRDMEYGIDGSSKQQHLQQQDQQPADQQQQDSYISGNCLHTHAAAAPCQGDAECSSDGSSSDSSGGGGRTVWHSQDAAAFPASCSAAAAASSSSSRPRLRCGPAVLGSQRSVAGVALLVGLGMVSLLVPASNTRGLFPAGHTAGITGSTAAAAAAAAAAAHPRNLEAGLPIPSLMHAAGSSSSSSNGTAWGVAGGDSPVEPPVRDLAFMVGTALGYCSSVLYLCSRVSQIYKNYCRQSSEGLALAMFMMAVCANLCTGTGIIMRTFTVRELMEQLPWIIGTLGTISLDMVILWQSLRYASKAHLARHAAAGGGADGGSSEEQRQLLHAHHHHHQVTVHLHHQQHALPAAGHAAVVGRGNGSSHSRAMAIPAATTDRHNISGDGMNMPHHLSSSAPVIPGWGGALSHRPEAGRRQAVAAEADHIDGADEAAPLLRVS